MFKLTLPKIVAVACVGLIAYILWNSPLAAKTPVPQPKPKATEFRFLGITPEGCGIFKIDGRKFLQCPRYPATPKPAEKTTTI